MMNRLKVIYSSDPLDFVVAITATFCLSDKAIMWLQENWNIEHMSLLITFIDSIWCLLGGFNAPDSMNKISE